jgi:hypothetical protein
VPRTASRTNGSFIASIRAARPVNQLQKIVANATARPDGSRAIS